MNGARPAVARLRLDSHAQGGEMAVTKELLEILVCPNCRGEVAYDEAAQTITCTGDCRYSYPVRDDIPIMLIDEATRPA